MKETKIQAFLPISLKDVELNLTYQTYLGYNLENQLKE